MIDQSRKSVRLAARHALIAAGGAAIVNISSINARLPFPMVVDYSAAKAALTNLNKSLSEEFAPQGVRVNSIASGPVRTPFWTAPGGFADATAASAGTTAQEALDVAVPQGMGITTGRITEAHEVADLALFLVSPLAANITGTETLIDGGQAKTLRPDPDPDPPPRRDRSGPSNPRPNRGREGPRRSGRTLTGGTRTAPVRGGPGRT
ncbi:SDR family oxidoreductase [Streptomyces sp. NPDC002265]|uniref:SDR family NAD(P)-dependent oxidoreductase n=1 Tax=Streptomyces sp. NPDC002265 TaxID=3154415 RepID=UPI003333E4EA